VGQGRPALAGIRPPAFGESGNRSQTTRRKFHAPAFYEKSGYAEFGRLEDFPAGHTRYFLAKTL